MKLRIPQALAATLVLAAPLAAQQPKVDPRLPEYQRIDQQLAGTMNSVGSDTMLNLMTYWGEKFRDYYPGVKIQIEAKGSSTAPPALIAGASQFGPMSRKMKQEEVDKFIKKFGYAPTRIRTSLDALAVYVNKDNPIEGLTLEQVDAIFSKNRKRGHSVAITTWGQLGLGGQWAAMPITLFGRNSASGTYGFFKHHVLEKGDYKDTVKEQPGSAAVVQGVTADRSAIGYSGIGYITSGVRAVPLSEDGDEYFAADLENVVNGDYPLGRFLNLYINKRPNQELDPLRREFLRFILSREGQEVVIKAGYLPITVEVASQEAKALGIPFEAARKPE